MKISKRYKKDSFKTRVLRRISDVSREAWDRTFPDVLESYDFFKTLDESNLEQFSFYYILIYRHKALVGAAPCFLMKYSLDTSVNGPLRRFSNAVKRAVPNIFSVRTFVCGMPLGPGRIGAPGDAPAVLNAVLRRMERMARKERVHIIAFKDFDGSYTKMLDPLQRDGFVKVEGLPTTEMNIWFSDFDEYLKTLSAASRYDLRRKFRKVDKLGGLDMEIMPCPDEPTLSEVYRLYLEIVKKHDMGFELLPIDFFRNLSKNMPRQVKFFLWRTDNKLIGFLLCLVSDKTLIDYYVGLDYTVALRYHFYFVKFRDVMKWCIANKIERYEMGITGYEPKRRLGFNFIPLYIYAKFRGRALRPLFKIFCRLLKFENFDPALRQAKKAVKNRPLSGRDPL